MRCVVIKQLEKVARISKQDVHGGGASLSVVTHFRTVTCAYTYMQRSCNPTSASHTERASRTYRTLWALTYHVVHTRGTVCVRNFL